MKSKTKKIIFIVLTVIIVAVAIYFVCYFRGTTDDNKKTLTVAEEITLNNDEKELLSELVNVNNQLLNPKQEEANTNETDYTEVVKPVEPVALKDFCKKLYEARKTTNEQGETVYLFDMDTVGANDETVRRIIVTRDGEMTGCTFVENDYAEAVAQAGNTTVDGSGIELGGEILKAIFEGLTKTVNETWEQATIYENVNYDNILSKI